MHVHANYYYWHYLHAHEKCQCNCIHVVCDKEESWCRLLPAGHQPHPQREQAILSKQTRNWNKQQGRRKRFCHPSRQPQGTCTQRNFFTRNVNFPCLHEPTHQLFSKNSLLVFWRGRSTLTACCAALIFSPSSTIFAWLYAWNLPSYTRYVVAVQILMTWRASISSLLWWQVSWRVVTLNS